MLNLRVASSLLVLMLLSSDLNAQNPARGRALCIGLNVVDENHYGSPLRLAGCRNDATDFATILRGIEAFDEPKLLLDSQATVAAVEQEIRSAADDLKDGDLFVLTIASHGSQLPDHNGDEALLDASDRLDETWLLFDRMWIDDERYRIWKEFDKGVRVLVVSDTCHSGTTLRNPFSGSGGILLNGVLLNNEALSAATIPGQRGPGILLRGTTSLQSDRSFFESLINAQMRATAFPIRDGGEEIRGRGLGREVGIETRAIADLSQPVRSISRSDAVTIYAARSNVYDPILKGIESVSERSPLEASIILLAACQDFQTAADGDLNGAFTGTVKEVWNGGFEGTYEEFLNRVKSRMFSNFFEQIPNYLTMGTMNDSFHKKSQRPFSVRLPDRSRDAANPRAGQEKDSN